MEGKWAERVLSLGMTIECLLTIYVINHFLFEVSNFFYNIWIKSQEYSGREEKKVNA